MGVGVGTTVIRNKELLRTIQSNHPDGIYSTADFLSRIKSGDTFFSTKYGSLGNLPYKLVKTEKYTGTATELKNSYTYIATSERRTKNGFVDDFFWGDDAIFTDKNAMIAYQAGIRANEHKLDREAI